MTCMALMRSEEHTSELQSLTNLVCRLLLEKKKCQTVNRGGQEAAQAECAVYGRAAGAAEPYSVMAQPNRARKKYRPSAYGVNFFFNDAAPPEISPLPLRAALPL